MNKLLFTAIVFMITTAQPKKAQSLHGLHIGEDQSSLAKLGVPGAVEKYKSYVVRKWALANGNDEGERNGDPDADQRC